MNLDKIKRLYKQGKHSSGVSCSCVILSPTRVAKIFGSHRERNLHYYTQKDAATYGLGPKAYQRFKLGREYGYISERVYVCDHSILNNWEMQSHKFTQLVMKHWGKDLKKLKKDLKDKIGFEFSDDHPWNLGYSKSGKLLCIDFGGHCSDW
jgi:hypothetical protein